MEKEPGGGRKGGNNSLQRWQIVATAVVGVLGLALNFVLPREIMAIVIVCGVVLFVAAFLIGVVLVELPRARRARGCKEKELSPPEYS